MTSKTNTHRKNIAVYADGFASVYMLRDILMRTFAHVDVDVVFVKHDQVARGEFPNNNTILFILPGTPKGSSLYREQLGQKGFTLIRQHIERGMHYHGYCAGAYLAATEFGYFDQITGEQREIVTPLPLVEGRAEGPVPYYAERTNQIDRESGYAMARIAFTNAASLPDMAKIFYSAGPALTLYKDAEGQYETLARFLDVPEQPIAALRRTDLGLGTATLISFAPEIIELEPKYIRPTHNPIYGESHKLLHKEMASGIDNRKRFFVTALAPVYATLREQEHKNRIRGLEHVIPT